MKTLFESLGYQVTDKKIWTDSIPLELHYVNNPDGSTRWVWPSYLDQPLFLKFYNVSSIRSGLFVLFVKIIFRLNLQFLFFKTKTICVRPTPYCEFDFCFDEHWALFTGTSGPNNKLVVYQRKYGKSIFTKIARGASTTTLLEREHTMLQRLSHSNIQSFRVPESELLSDAVLKLSDVGHQGERCRHWTPHHLNTLIELNELTGIEMPLSENPTWLQLKKDFLKVVENNDTRLPKGMIRKLAGLIESTDETTVLEVGMSHGDFTPWNMFLTDQGLSVYDWELSDLFRPLGFDFFHFIIQQGILVDRKSWKTIHNDIRSYTNNSVFSNISKFDNEDSELYLKHYLLFNCMYYLKLYSRQTEWHPQVYWLLATWNDALSHFAEGYENKRELVLMDTFDFLVNRRYAAIKFQNMYPERLSLFSDVDLCIEKTEAKHLKNYLENHSLVTKVKSTKKSYMHTLQIFCKDGSLLSLDLIFKIKRKGLQSMEVKELLDRAYVNTFGIRMLELLDNARYIALFYVLNGSKIPAKFQHYEELVGRSAETIDTAIYPYYVDPTFHKKHLLAYIKKMPFNRGKRGFINQLFFVLDSLRAMFLYPGCIITFSGVDGAGKSTVINEVKYRIEKQMRKRVVVLRHRPSLLPILSAWVKGKKQAELDAASGLPRQGQNKNALSSLLRFGYYYSDYLIGQFLVHFKYVLRGYVVIYDRYYFDFINDSKRSNIELSPILTKLGYNFLLKPHYNFFLYAPAGVIRNRKQELSEETIESLTRSYQLEFERLRQRSSKSTYVSINNLKLNDTLDKVFTIINGQAA